MNTDRIKALARQQGTSITYICQLIDRDQIVFWLSQFKYGNIEDEDFRRRLIDLLVNSVTVWDEPDGYKITTAYNLTSCKTKTFRVEKNPAAEEATGFDFRESECTIGCEFEPYIMYGTIFVQTIKHSLP